MPIPTLSPMSVVGDVDITGNYRRNGSLLSASDVSAVALSLYGAKGSLAVGLSASVAGQLAVGSNGQVLTADSAQSHGVKWATVVTSVSMTVPSILSVSGSPVTSVGTLALSLSTQSANTVLAGPSGGGIAAPTFRGLVSADIPSLDTAKLTTGTLPIARGGTNNTSYTDYSLVFYNPSSTKLDTFPNIVVKVGAGTGSPTVAILTKNDAVTAPFWITATGWSVSATSSRSPTAGMSLSQLTDVVMTIVYDLKNLGVFHS